MTDRVSDEVTASTKPNSDAVRLVLIRPQRMMQDTFLQALFPDLATASSDEGLPSWFSPKNNLQITELSSLDLPAFNNALLTAEADIAVLIIDSQFGIEKRHHWTRALSCLAQIPHFILAIDNMVLSTWSLEQFRELQDEFTEHTTEFKCGSLDVVPTSIESKHNLETSSAHSPWYDGPALLSLIDRYSEQCRQNRAHASLQKPTQSSDQFAVHLCWGDETPLLPGRSYRLQLHADGKTQVTDARLSSLKHRINPLTLEHQAAKKLHLAEIGYGNISLDDGIDFAPFEEDRQQGSFTLLDKKTGSSVAFGLVKHGLRRATNIKWHQLEVDKKSRAASKAQTPCVLWFTGLSGSGKSTVASLVDKELHAAGKHSYVLDGDNVRHGLCRDLGFTDADRVENQRRISETAKLFVDAGLIVLVSFISPFRSERQAARKLFEQQEFLEIFVDTPLETCENRDPKGLYKKARAGQLKNFTGIDSPYEPPQAAEIHLQGGEATPEQMAEMIIAEITDRQILDLSQ